jgi:6-phospho-3-hexuloisomerase
MTESARALAASAAECVGGIDPNETDALLRSISGAKRIFFVGAGRTGLVARAMVMRLRQLGREAFMAGEAATPAANTKDLVIVCSGSFRSTTTLAIYQKTIEAKIPTVVVTTTEAPKDYGKATAVVLIPVGERARRAPLGTVFELSLLLLFDGLVLALMDQLGIGEKQMRARHATLE